MKKIIFFFIFFCTFIQIVKAEIVYIDINSILNKSDVGKSLNDFLEKIENKDLEKYKLIEAQLIKKEKELIAQQNILVKDEFQKKLASLTTEVQKYRSDKKTSLDELNKLKIEKTKEILKVLNPIITKYVDLNSISLVIPKKNIIVGKKNLDITEQIIQLLNNDIKKLKF
tara:strand:- start:964 stop:1473 length:510 start_codon:yes stop_codon:yes gene_type:complete